MTIASRDFLLRPTSLLGFGGLLLSTVGGNALSRTALQASSIAILTKNFFECCDRVVHWKKFLIQDYHRAVTQLYLNIVEEGISRNNFQKISSAITGLESQITNIQLQLKGEENISFINSPELKNASMKLEFLKELLQKFKKSIENEAYCDLGPKLKAYHANLQTLPAVRSSAKILDYPLVHGQVVELLKDITTKSGPTTQYKDRVKKLQSKFSGMELVTNNSQTQMPDPKTTAPMTLLRRGIDEVAACLETEATLKKIRDIHRLKELSHNFYNQVLELQQNKWDKSVERLREHHTKMKAKLEGYVKELAELHPQDRPYTREMLAEVAKILSILGQIIENPQTLNKETALFAAERFLYDLGNISTPNLVARMDKEENERIREQYEARERGMWERYVAIHKTLLAEGSSHFSSLSDYLKALKVLHQISKNPRFGFHSDVRIPTVLELPGQSQVHYRHEKNPNKCDKAKKLFPLAVYSVYSLSALSIGYRLYQQMSAGNVDQL